MQCFEPIKEKKPLIDVLHCHGGHEHGLEINKTRFSLGLWETKEDPQGQNWRLPRHQMTRQRLLAR